MNKTGKILACIELAFYWVFIGRWSMGEDGLQARGSGWCQHDESTKKGAVAEHDWVGYLHQERPL